MTRRGAVTAMIVGAAGALASGALIARFLRAYRNNLLDWREGITPPEFYEVVGRQYWQGFLAGFFLCLFLMLVGAGLQAYRAYRPPSPQQP